MLEDVLANTSLPPEAMALCALAAIACFAVGWMGRGARAKRREEQHKRDVLEAKSSIPTWNQRSENANRRSLASNWK